MKELENCTICPHECGVNRNIGNIGICGVDAGYHIASICIHKGEEPPINGLKGICNVFFTGCNLKCQFCQNDQISHIKRNNDKRNIRALDQVTADIIAFLKQGIEAVGFVSPTHFTPHVREIIRDLNTKGFHPISVYNTNGYDKTEVLKSLEGLIDVYLPDMKYFDVKIAQEYSGAIDYPKVAQKALREMYRQKGSTVVLNDHGQAVTGLIIRHLVLPGHAMDSIRILQWIAEELSPSVSISLMSQYYPTQMVEDHPVLGRKIMLEEYHVVLNALESLGLYKGWIQEPDSAVNYLPDFNKKEPFEEQID